MRAAPEVRLELAHNQAYLMSNKAYVLLASSDPSVADQAEAAAEETRTVAERLTGLRRDQHESSSRELRGRTKCAG